MPITTLQKRLRARQLWEAAGGNAGYVATADDNSGRIGSLSANDEMSSPPVKAIWDELLVILDSSEKPDRAKLHEIRTIVAKFVDTAAARAAVPRPTQLSEHVELIESIAGKRGQRVLRRNPILAPRMRRAL